MKKIFFVVLKSILIFWLAALVAIAIHWAKPYSKVGDTSADFIVLNEEANSITTAKYKPENRCGVTPPIIVNQSPTARIQIRNSDYYYTVTPLDKGAVQVEIQGGVFHYEYLVSNGCITPLRQKLFSAWELLLAFALSAGIVLWASRWLKRITKKEMNGDGARDFNE